MRLSNNAREGLGLLETMQGPYIVVDIERRIRTNIHDCYSFLSGVTVVEHFCRRIDAFTKRQYFIRYGSNQAVLSVILQHSNNMSGSFGCWGLLRIQTECLKMGFVYRRKC